MKSTFIHLADLAISIDNSISSEVSFTFPSGVSFDLFRDMDDLIIQDENSKNITPSGGLSSKQFTLSFHRYMLRERGIICADDVDSYIRTNLTNQILEGTDPATGLQIDINSNVFIIGKQHYTGNQIELNKDLWNANNSFMLYRWICLKADLRSEGKVFYLTHEPLELIGGRFCIDFIRPLNTRYSEFQKYFSNSGESENKSDEKRAMFKSQLSKALTGIADPSERMKWLFSYNHFDVIFEKTKLAFDRYVMRYSEDRLAAKLEQESLDFLERIKGIRESLKSELLVLATNGLGVSFLDFETTLSVKNVLILLVVILINVVFQFVLNNGVSSLNDLHKFASKRQKMLIEHNPKQQKREITDQFTELFGKIQAAKRQFIVSSFIIWTPITIIIFMALINLFLNPSTQGFDNSVFVYLDIIHHIR